MSLTNEIAISIDETTIFAGETINNVRRFVSPTLERSFFPMPRRVSIDGETFA